MRKFQLLAIAILNILSGNGFAADDAVVRIAVMPDVHFHDVYADLGDGSFSGVRNPRNGKNAFIRTMHSQLTSTRLFNENYFVFLAALDDAVSRGIRCIVLPGDFTDDGQPVHTVAVKKILDAYSEKHGVIFLLTNGNHDPYRPYGRPSGKKDFLGHDGSDQRVFSRGLGECRDYDGESALIATGDGLPVACTEAIRELGYAEIGDILAGHGFKPQRSYLYWETPFSTYDENSYDFEKARIESRWENRTYEICLEGAGGRYKRPEYTICAPVPDSSYLVEPVKDVWLLVIDANIFRISEKAEHHYPTYPGLFEGSTGAGYNAMPAFKPHVLDWMKSVAERARRNGKRLVTVSHFPMTEYYGGIGEDIRALFGDGKLQTGRLPSEKTMTMLAETGIGVHVGGHMHLNSTTSVRSGDNFLVNIQAPSLSSYVSGYKVLTLRGSDQVEVETVQLDDVPRFDELFELYRLEHAHLLESGSKNIWDASILESKNFREFIGAYFRELTRHRFIPREWPADLRSVLPHVTGADLLVLSQFPDEVPLDLFGASPGQAIADTSLTLADSIPSVTAPHDTIDFAAHWKAARLAAQHLLVPEGITLDDLDWSGFELVLDFHRIINAGELALADIPEERLHHYGILARLLHVLPDGDSTSTSGTDGSSHISVADWIKSRPGAVLRILCKRLAAEPSDDFLINLTNKTVERMGGKPLP